MTRCLTVIAVAFAALWTAGACVAEGVTRELFNGRTLEGWHISNCEAVVENECLVLKSGNGLVRSDHRYGDFTLQLQWRARQEKDYDSGIYFRAELPMGPRPWPTRYQVNLLQGQEGNVTTVPAAKSMGLIKTGEWNQFKLTVIGSQASMEINGKPAWQVDNIEAASGYIGFQAEVPKGGQFEFRDVRLTEHGYRSLFNGQDLTHWEGATTDASACWKVEEGLLMCTGQKGPWLRSKEEFGDFNLRLEYKLKPGGNSGVYVRVPKGALIAAARPMAAVLAAWKCRSWTMRTSATRPCKRISTLPACMRSRRPSRASANPRASGTRWRSTARGRTIA